VDLDKIIADAAGDTHTAAEMMIRLATRMWLVQANKFGATVADSFIEALALDIMDRAKTDGASVREKTAN
jgi:hypothetical protein